MLEGGNKAVFLDRDGTINVEKHYLYKIEDFEYLEGALDALKTLSEMGFKLIIVTNQSGIARGYYSENDFKQLDDWMRKDLLDKGIIIADSYYCPHLPGGSVKKYAKVCECRKPKTGLYWKAAKDYNIDMDNSYAIGDKTRDLSICKESGVKGILLSTKLLKNQGYDICSTWEEVVNKIKIYEGQK